MPLRREGKESSGMRVYAVTSAQALIELMKPKEKRDPHMLGAVELTLKLMARGFEPIREFVSGGGSMGTQGTFGVYSYTLWAKDIELSPDEDVLAQLSVYYNVDFSGESGA